MNQDVTDAVKGKWYGVLSTLGIPKEFLQKKNGPCPLCGGKDRYCWTNYNDDGLYLCRHCGNGNGWGLLQKYMGWNFPQAADAVAPLVGILNMGRDKPSNVQEYNPVPALQKVARTSTNLTWGSGVMDYLRKRGFDQMPDGLRQATLDYYESGSKQGTYQALVALIQDWEGNGASYHITYIENGSKAKVKAARKIMKPKNTITGAAVRLHTEFEDRICIAEGIESAWGAHKDCGLPAFAALNAGNLMKFIPPKGVKVVFIYGDNDLNFVGQVAAYTLAKSLKEQEIDAYVFIPDKFGTDWNDGLPRVEK